MGSLATRVVVVVVVVVPRIYIAGCVPVVGSTGATMHQITYHFHIRTEISETIVTTHTSFSILVGLKNVERTLSVNDCSFGNMNWFHHVALCNVSVHLICTWYRVNLVKKFYWAVYKPVMRRI